MSTALHEFTEDRSAADLTRIAPVEVSAGMWGRASTWGLMLLLLYYALNGTSPFVNDPTAMRMVATNSSDGVAFERFTKLLVFLLCMVFVVLRRHAVGRLCSQMKLVTSFPILALLLLPVSQLASRTISSGLMLTGGVLLVYSIMGSYTLNQVLEQLLVLGTVTIVASIFFALALPEYGLDRMGGHATAWKGVFVAKNYLGDIALFFLTAAVSYSGRTSFLRGLRICQIPLCLVAIAFSQAATAYILTAVYVVYLAVVKILHRFGKRDYFVVSLCMLVAMLLAAAAIFLGSPDFVFNLLGKDSTLTGRTQIWSAVLDSIAKRPLLGYGYQAFWLGLEGESYRVILAVSWMLAQAQSGFLDIMLEMGMAGLTLVLLIFGFAFRDAGLCLFRSRDDARLRAVEWYLAVVLLTFLYNLDESFLFDPKHFGSLLFVLACVGLKQEWMRVHEGTVHAR